jgi:excisionase family DNA binding protein
MSNDLCILSTKEASKLIRISANKLRELADGGVIPAYRIGKNWRYRREDLVRWVERQALANVSPECSTFGASEKNSEDA